MTKHSLGRWEVSERHTHYAYERAKWLQGRGQRGEKTRRKTSFLNVLSWSGLNHQCLSSDAIGIKSYLTQNEDSWDWPMAEETEYEWEANQSCCFIWQTAEFSDNPPPAGECVGMNGRSSFAVSNPGAHQSEGEHFLAQVTTSTFVWIQRADTPL